MVARARSCSPSRVGARAVDDARITHRVVGALIVRGGAVLLCHRRSDRRWYPDCWDLPGGHVEGGEDPRATIDRECREELGIDVLAVSPVPFRCNDVVTSLTVLRVEDWHGEPANCAPEEHDAIAWLTETDLAGTRLADPGLRPLLASTLDHAHAGTRAGGPVPRPTSHRPET